LLSITLLCNSVAFAAAKPADPVKLKQTLTARGIGKDIKVKELDGTTVTGILTGIHDDSLDITPGKTAQAVTIQYAQVSAVNHGMSTGSKVGIGVGIGVAIFAVWGIAAVAAGSK
jgi:hypothetical protein